MQGSLLRKGDGDKMKAASVFDIETDGLSPTKIHVLSVKNSCDGDVHSTNDYDKMREFFTNAKILVGHNIIRYDLVAVEKLLGVKFQGKVVDTLAVSWYIEPSRQRHGLADWGVEFGIPKPVIDDWDNLSYEEYKHRCEEDVKINFKLWERLWGKLLTLYEGDEAEAWRLIDYLTFKMECAAEQERSGWKLDIEKCEDG